MLIQSDLLPLERGCRLETEDCEAGVRSIGEVLAEWFDRHPGILQDSPVFLKTEVAAVA